MSAPAMRDARCAVAEQRAVAAEHDDQVDVGWPSASRGDRWSARLPFELGRALSSR